MSDTPKFFFDEVFPKRMAENPGKVSAINAVFQFNITGDNGGKWVLDLTGAGAVKEGEAPAQCTLTMTSEDFVAMMQKKANPMQLFTTQKLKVTGNLPLSLKLQALI